MGQSRPAIAYGITLTREQEERVNAALTTDDGWRGFKYEDAPNAFDTTSHARTYVLGFVVAVECDAHKHKGALALDPFVVPCDSAAIEAIVGPKRMDRARRLWNRLDKAAREKGVTLPAPGFVSSTIETA